MQWALETEDIMNDPFGIAPSQPGSSDAMGFGDGGHHERSVWHRAKPARIE